MTCIHFKLKLLLTQTRMIHRFAELRKTIYLRNRSLTRAHPWNANLYAIHAKQYSARSK